MAGMYPLPLSKHHHVCLLLREMPILVLREAAAIRPGRTRPCAIARLAHASLSAHPEVAVDAAWLAVPRLNHDDRTAPCGGGTAPARPTAAATRCTRPRWPASMRSCVCAAASRPACTDAHGRPLRAHVRGADASFPIPARGGIAASSGERLACEPVPQFLMDMVAAGGLLNQLRRSLGKEIRR